MGKFEKRGAFSGRKCVARSAAGLFGECKLEKGGVLGRKGAWNWIRVLLGVRNGLFWCEFEGRGLVTPCGWGAM